VGITVCILLLLFGYKADVAAWSISSLMALVCGIYYPISILPSPLPVVAKAIPLTYFLEYFRSFYGFGGERGNLLVLGFGLTGFYLMVEALLLKMVLYRARKTGFLIKLSE
jgi:ABC-2 type transport system permease protein